ncbi:MAG: protein-glutamate O-methyltransferase CheR [Kofleriaceae bacterium]
MDVSADELDRFTHAVELQLGIRVADRATAMAEILARRADRFATVGAYIACLEAADHEELRALVTEVSIGETYFFRHAEQCQAYAALLPAIAARRGHVRVLSAGCSSGEEPYTLAMLARERLADRHAVSVHAFDFNPAALARAVKARYSRWALRATSPAQERRWFVAHGREVELVPEIKRAVAFREANLLCDGDWTRERWDVIFCRNVIMYFSAERALAAVRRMTEALAPGGYLFLGHAETLRERVAELELCHSHGTFYYRRGGEPIAVATPPSGDWAGEISNAARRVHAIIDGHPGAGDANAAPAPAAALAAICVLIGEERFAEATEALAGLPEASARTSEARLYGAIVQAHTGAPALAEQTCRELIETALPDARAHYLLALCRAGAVDAIGAEHHARAALALAPDFAMARVQLAFIARRAGAHDEARAQLLRALAHLDLEGEERFALFAGGFSRTALVALCRGELAALATLKVPA